MTSDENHPLLAVLSRIADSLDEIAGKHPADINLEQANAFTWQSNPDRLEPVDQVSRVPLDILQGIDRVRDILFDNTKRFAKGFLANNALLWGARGMGKSSLVKACHNDVSAAGAKPQQPGELETTQPPM